MPATNHDPVSASSSAHFGLQSASPDRYVVRAWGVTLAALLEAVRDRTRTAIKIEH
jgi:hypothetical protein